MQIIGNLCAVENGITFEIPALGIYTGFVNNKHRLEQAIIEAISGLILLRFKRKVKLSLIFKENKFYVYSDNTEILLSLIILRQRGKAGLSLSEMQKAMQQKSKGAISKYESGTVEAGISKITEFLKVSGLDIAITINERIEPKTAKNTFKKSA